MIHDLPLEFADDVGGLDNEDGLYLRVLQARLLPPEDSSSDVHSRLPAGARRRW